MEVQEEVTDPLRCITSITWLQVFNLYNFDPVIFDLRSSVHLPLDNSPNISFSVAAAAGTAETAFQEMLWYINADKKERNKFLENPKVREDKTSL